MGVTRGIAAAAMLAGLAIGTASTARATPTMSGHYIATFTASTGQSTTNDWYFTPCGDGCAQLTRPVTAQARFVNGRWTVDSTADATCPDGTSVPHALTAHDTWDPNTLAGTDQITHNLAACGNPAAHQATNKLQLKQAL